MQVKLPSCIQPEVSSVSADEARSESTSVRRVIVASSVMSDERLPRSSTTLSSPLKMSYYLIILMFHSIGYSTISVSIASNI